MLRSRRGISYIAEASLIYPVIVAVTILLLAAAVYIYGLTAACADMNRTVRRAAGEKSFTVFYNEEDDLKGKRVPVMESGGFLFKKVSAVSRKSYVSRIVFSMSGENEYRAEAFVISEADELWNRQAVGNAVETIKD